MSYRHIFGPAALAEYKEAVEIAETVYEWVSSLIK